MWLRYSFQTPFWCYISVGGHPGVTSVQGGILADYGQNSSRGLDSPDTKFQLPQSPGNYVPLTLYVEILFWANVLRTPYGLTLCHVSSGRHIGWLRPNRMAWQWAETLVEIRGTLADIRGTTKLGYRWNFPKHKFNRTVCLEAHLYLLAHLLQ